MNAAVSRETPPAPATALGVFPHSLELAQRFARLLSDQGVLRGLIGPREVPRLWERHLMNCALLGRAIPERQDVADIGSGAGLPGLVLALSRPDLEVTLVEPLERRTSFLIEAVAALELSNVEVIRGRAEELHGLREFSVVTSRAVAPLDRLLRWSMPLVRPGGALVAMKGATVHDEIKAASKALSRFDAGAVSVEIYGSDLIDPPTTVIRVVQSGPQS
ncbi:MAG TPA: 16S rRNA (guanine(527)-N(7))-methyltransferase RsmG [Nocardioidaceae bacterium]|nr:16S rRNA (guanine(527)-N(7))-methyltransferase RsmG [Nocardioidaceae bacterium]